MCGICGLAGAITDDATLKRMLERLKHRGPDGSGMWSDHAQRIALGHTRLAIIDTSDAGRQPMHLDGLHAAVNGEIYNYPALREDLESRHGAQFASHCDSEIVLHGYRYEGVDFFKRLNGMFAIALYDEARGRLLLLRDRIGIKPLYYCYKDNRFAFASEIKSLLAAFDENRWPIDRLGLAEYLTYQTTLADRTLFSGVKLLEPGHLLVVAPSHLTVPKSQPFYEADTVCDEDISFGEAVAQYGKVFEESVKRHLLSDVPVATYISAGFDSASVAMQAARSSGSPLGAYTGRFRGQGEWYDETKVAAEAVRSFGGQHQAIDIADADFAAQFDAVIEALDEPKMGMGAFSQFMVARAAAKKYKVILTGHGGDELFSGYPIFKIGMLRPAAIRWSEWPHVGYFLWSGLRKFLWPEFGRYLPVLWPRRLQKTLAGDALVNVRPWEELVKLQSRGRTAIDRIFQTYLRVYLPGLLVVEDKISMAHSIESRTPMLDNAMLELSLKIPQAVKLHGNNLKAIIKENARALLPAIYFRQPKRGFPTPLRFWLRGSLKGFLHQRITHPHSRLRRLFDVRALERQVRAYEKSPLRFFRPLDEIQSHRMWQLLSLEAWLRIWEEKYGIKLVLK